jgi:hypothetical protein
VDSETWLCFLTFHMHVDHTPALFHPLAPTSPLRLGVAWEWGSLGPLERRHHSAALVIFFGRLDFQSSHSGAMAISGCPW